MNRFRILYKFILHFLTARNTHGFGVHSPSVYHFTKFVLDNRGTYYVFSGIEKIRKALKKDKRVVDFVDFGTGGNRRRKIAGIASTSLKSAKYGQLLYRLTKELKARNVLELGTSLGITTAYLASVSTGIRCVSMEGSPEIARIANDNFGELNIKNIKIEVGDINLNLSKVLDEFETIDLIFMDANHTQEAVLEYFEKIVAKVHQKSVVVVDDIYWSSDMEKAWIQLKEHPRVTSTIDLFQMGIVFFNTDLHKKHYKMRY